MLYQTFCHIGGIGTTTEDKLWKNGITNWQDYAGQPASMKLKPQAKLELSNTLKASYDAIEQENPLFFTERLASHMHWRIFPHFRYKTAYIDIETTGLSENADITTIALYDGNEIYSYVNGINLDDFVNDVDKFKVLVSYNGKTFDIPFIERFFKINLKHLAQIDLRYVLAKLGYKGGLKGCEKQMGINRGGLDGVDGYEAVLLWQEYEQYNNKKALETLISYNIEDTVNLEKLIIMAYNENVKNSPFCDKLQLSMPKPPTMQHHPDHEVLDAIRNKYRTV